MSLIVISRDHIGKPDRLDDRGAAADTDGDGIIGHDEREAYFTRWIAGFTEDALVALGHEVIPISDGTYAARHARANDYGADIYLALHLNAGAGNYSLVLYDYRSRRGRGDALAEAISRRLSGQAVNGKGLAHHGTLRRVIGESRRVLPTHPSDWRKNAHYTIKGLGAPVGICLESFFLDHEAHQELLTAENLQLVGEAIAHGCHDWITARETT